MPRHEKYAFGPVIRPRRKELGLSLGDVSRKTGIPLPDLSKLENHPRGIPAVDQWLVLCLALGLHPIEALAEAGAIDEDTIGDHVEFLAQVLTVPETEGGHHVESDLR